MTGENSQAADLLDRTRKKHFTTWYANIFHECWIKHALQSFLKCYDQHLHILRICTLNGFILCCCSSQIKPYSGFFFWRNIQGTEKLKLKVLKNKAIVIPNEVATYWLEKTRGEYKAKSRRFKDLHLKYS